ncbi:MAG TPA: TadE family protein [Candidatus Limnocylindria bacterium]|nr:TadE family protein [Candidatus Limnocylindria bacterium]
MLKFIRESAGQSLVEMALGLPLLVFGLLGGADLARAYALQLAVQNGARAGAEAAAIDFAPTRSTITTRTRDEMDRTPGMNSAAATITVTFKQTDGATDCIDPPTPAMPCYATVRVQYTFRTITPWPWIPNTYVFDRTNTFRTIKGGALPT